MQHIYNKKPSERMLRTLAFDAMRNGASMIDVRWGEQWIEIERFASVYCGSGWIGRTSGDDLASEFNAGRGIR